MVTNALCKSFQRLGLSTKGTILVRYCSTNTSQIVWKSTPSLYYKPSIDTDKSIYEPKFRLSSVNSATLDLDLPNRSALITEIGEFPFDTKLRIGEPPKIQRKQEDIVPDKSLDLPSTENVIEKRAERMIVIRRRKMRRHKLRKLRKRMKFFWGKIKQRREMKKEKAFHAELLAKIRKAENFNPQEYVASKLAILDNVRIPNRYRGEYLPEAQIREFLQKDEEKRLKKKNKPRLTLD